MESPGKQHRGLVIGAVVALGLLGVLVVALDGREVRRVVEQASWGLVPFAVLFTAVSYACLSYGFAVINQLFGTFLGKRDLVEIGFVSFALNNLVSVGGTAGVSLRLLLMQKRGIAAGDIVAASLLHSYFNHLVQGGLLPIGMLYLVARHPLSAAPAWGIGAAAGLMLLVLGAATAMVFVRRARTAILGLAGRGAWRLGRRDVSPALARFDATLERGVAVLRARPRLAVLILGLIVLDWAATLVALGFCFDALGTRLGPGVLVTGFAVGVTLGLLSMLPGGLGVQEGSMAGVYRLLGVPFEQAVLASILFRLVYYLVPFSFSLLLYWRLLRARAASAVNERPLSDTAP